jgi:hypothetical protein
VAKLLQVVFGRDSTMKDTRVKRRYRILFEQVSGHIVAESKIKFLTGTAFVGRFFAPDGEW